MALVMIQEPPEEMFRPEMYDKVNEKVGLSGNEPEGLIAHTIGQDDAGKWRIVDVWESREAYDRFTEERLRPALEATFKENGIDIADAPDPTSYVYETYDVYVPGAAAAR